MNKKDLSNLGIEDEDIAQKIIVLHGKDIEKLKTDVESRDGELKTLQSQIEEATKTIEGFKEMDIEGVKQKAEEWKTKAEQIEKEAAVEMQKLKFEHTLESALANSKARNTKTVKALLNLDDLKMSEETGNIIGLDEQLQKITEEHDYLFESDKTIPKIVTGAQNKNVSVDTMLEAARKGAGLTDD